MSVKCKVDLSSFIFSIPSPPAHPSPPHPSLNATNVLEICATFVCFSAQLRCPSLLKALGSTKVCTQEVGSRRQGAAV